MPYKNKEDKRKYSQKYYREHPRPQRKSYYHEYYLKNKEKLLESSKLWQEAHPGKTHRPNYAQDYYLKNKEHLKAKSRGWSRWLKQTVLEHYSNGVIRCAFCGIEDVDVLCLDHIDDNGAEHREKIGMGNTFYNWLVRNNFPEGLQVLCANCNLKKEILRRRNAYDS